MNDQLITLLILVAIAAFLLYRLKDVIGTRTGHENPGDYVKGGGGPDGKVVALPTAKDRSAEAAVDDVSRFVDPESEAGEALLSMKAIEPDFDVGGFLEGAKAAYEMIFLSFERGDLEAIRPFLADDVFEGFETAIADRAEQGLTIDTSFIGIRGCELVGARFDSADSRAEISVRFGAEMTTVVRNAEGETVEGDPSEIRRETDTWTFGRIVGAPDPNWNLVATGA